MASFKDTKGREWLVRVDVGAIKRVRDVLKIDLLESNKGEGLLGRLAADPVAVADILYVLCRKAADVEGIDAEEFGSGLGGDVLGKAIDCLLDEYIAFFPNPAQRAALAKVRAKMDRLNDLAIQAAETRIESPEMETEFKALLAKEMDRPLTGGGKSTGTPASSESPPTP